MRAEMLYLGRSKWIGASSASIIPFSHSDIPERIDAGGDAAIKRCRKERQICPKARHFSAAIGRSRTDEWVSEVGRRKKGPERP